MPSLSWGAWQSGRGKSGSQQCHVKRSLSQKSKQTVLNQDLREHRQKPDGFQLEEAGSANLRPSCVLNQRSARTFSTQEISDRGQGRTDSWLNTGYTLTSSELIFTWLEHYRKFLRSKCYIRTPGGRARALCYPPSLLSDLSALHSLRLLAASVGLRRRATQH